MDWKHVLRVLGFGVGALLLFPASAEGQRYGDRINRPGGDFVDFDLPQPDPRLCQAACDRHAQCRAWTYVRPGRQATRPRCWLKNTVPFPIEDACCVSGVDRRAGDLYQEGTDRPGMDYRSFNLNRAEPALCEAACVAQGVLCRAWSYVGPGVQGPYARCWLKKSVPPPRPDPCCVSGIRPRK